jgi:hypothetical protein
MSTVLWSHSLIAGVVSSDQEDLHALYQHTRKLDAICKKLKLRALSSFVDNTDLLINQLTNWNCRRVWRTPMS